MNTTDWLTVSADICRPAKPANASRAHADTWAVNPTCLVCETRTPSVARSAYLDTAEGGRVTCVSPCFAIAIQRTNPTFNKHAAARRQER